MERKLNILYLCGSYGLDLDNMLGPKRHVQSILSGLTINGHAPLLLAVQKKKELQEYKNFDYFVIRHKAMRFYIHKILPYTGLYNSFRVFFKILKINRSKKINIIHERYTKYSWGGLFASKLLKIPYILEMNGPVIEEIILQGIKKTILLYNLLYFHQKLLINHSSSLLFPSKSIPNFIQSKRNWSISDSKINVLYNSSFLYPTISSSEKKLNKSKYNYKNKINAIYCGSLTKLYKSFEMIKAFELVLSKNDDIDFHIFGQGDLYEKTKDYVDAKKIEDRIIIHGSVPIEEIYKVIQISDYCIDYCTDEIVWAGSSTKMGEYFMSNKPIISTKHTNEVIKNMENGILSPSSEYIHFSNTVLYCLNNHQNIIKTVGIKNREFAKKKFNNETNTQELIKIYEINIQKKL